MPTYVCFAYPDRLSPGQMEKIAEAITRVHSEEAVAPGYLVQVVFQPLAASRHFVGGAPGPQGQIWIRGDIRAGRTEAQRTRLQLRLAEEVGAIAGSAPEDLWIYLNEMQPRNMMEFGHLLPEPGAEGEWFRALPENLRTRLGRLSAR